MNMAINPAAVWLAAPLLAFMVFAPIQHMRAAAQQKVRQAAVAGSFYPAGAGELSAAIDALLAQAGTVEVSEPIIAVVAPHAGYAYSGPVAAYTYKALHGRKFARVVVIAPSHFEGFDFTSVYDGDGYATPLGTVPVDKAFAAQLAKMDPSIRLSSKGHEPTAAGGEHALEVQLPWLQKVLGTFELVPVVMGDQSYESSRALGVALAKLIHGSDTLVLASSDLSHYHPYDQAVTIDHKSLGALESWDYLSMSRNFNSRVWEACGGAPIVATMIYAERMGANRARVLKYANSGDVTGDRERVVGYSADVFVKAPPEKAEAAPFALSDAEKSELLGVARLSVEHAVREGKPYVPAASQSLLLNQERGAFVTLKEHGELRGCIGYTSAVKPLYVTVRDVATYAALQDPRFQAVSEEELPRLEYEISVLSPMRRVMDTEKIQVGVHGLLMKNGDHEGLLLPQVPVEQSWDRKTFLEQTCVKAGMHKECWKEEGTDIFQFTAVVFGPHKP